MPLMPEFVPSQSTDFACEKLANRAIALLRDPANGRDEAALQNLVRLLEMYRYDEYADGPSPGVLEYDDADHMIIEPLEESGTLVRALDVASKAAYPDTPKAIVVDALENVIEQLARQASELRDAARAISFFEVLARNLQRV